LGLADIDNQVIDDCNAATKEIGILRVLAVLLHACIKIGSQSI